MEEIKARHKKELKDNQAKIMQLKKSIGGNKKRKKEVQQEISTMEAEIKLRHQKEIDEWNANNKENNEESKEENENNSEDPVKNILENDKFPIHEVHKKVNRQKLRKERKAAKMLEMRKEAEEEAKNMVNTKQVEEDSLKEKLDSMNLQIFEVAADGHCLYNAISHQLSLYGKKMDYKELRSTAASYMRDHPDDFLPFLLNDNGDLYSKDEYQKYCDEVQYTALWGGQLEIQAISQALKYPITIVQSGSALIEIGNEFKNDKLYLSYHLHSFGLGAHYNSLIKK